MVPGRSSHREAIDRFAPSPDVLEQLAAGEYARRLVVQLAQCGTLVAAAKLRHPAIAAAAAAAGMDAFWTGVAYNWNRQ